MIRRVLPLVVAALFLAAGCGNHNSPTAPSQQSSRIISVTGNLHFGDVIVGQDAVHQITIANTGTSTLTVSGVRVTGGVQPYDAFVNWTNGPIAAGASQLISFRFTPTTIGAHSGTFEVQSDATSGTATLAFDGNGLDPGPPFTVSGTGDNVFDMPANVKRVHVVATYDGASSNFIVHLNGGGWINELIGYDWDSTTYDGTLLIDGGGTVSIEHSSGVQWTFTEVR